MSSTDNPTASATFASGKTLELPALIRIFAAGYRSIFAIADVIKAGRAVVEQFDERNGKWRPRWRILLSDDHWKSPAKIGGFVSAVSIIVHFAIWGKLKIVKQNDRTGAWNTVYVARSLLRTV